MEFEGLGREKNGMILRNIVFSLIIILGSHTKHEKDGYGKI